MASGETPGPSNEGINAENESFLPEYPSLNVFTQHATRAVLQTIRTSSQIPSTGDDYDYYSSFDAFRQLMDIEGTKILDIMQSIMKHHGVKGNLSSTSQAVDIEDKFDVLIDANDQLLERAGTFLDEASGLRKTEAPLVVASLTSPAAATRGQQLSGSWNRKSKSKSPKGQRFRLLSAKNIARPQLQFREKIDNTSKPWIPRISSKPNALKTLEESLVFDRDPADIDDSFVYPHPYQFELDNFSPSEEHLQITVPKTALPPDETPLVLVDTIAALESMVTNLSRESEIAIDVEHHSYRSYQGLTCLIQISTRSCDFLVDALALRHDLQPLNRVTTDPAIVKVLHGADSDIMWLQRDAAVYIVNMFDTGQAARTLGLARASLAHLLEMYCQVTPNKEYQLADWRIRPLPEELIRYAREDTHYLLYIYDRMKNELVARGNSEHNLLRGVVEKSRQICAQRYEKPRLDADSYKRLYLKTRSVFSSQQLFALRGLYSWRDGMARMEDESTGYVLPNHMLLQIAEVLPKEAAGVIALCNPVPPLVKQNVHEIFSIVKEAREQTLQKVVPQKPASAPTRQQHPKYNARSALNCPHDLTRPPRPAPPAATLDVSLLASSSAMFGNSPSGVTSEVKVKVTPLMAAFGWNKQMSSAVQQKTESAIRAAAVRAALSSPFSKYLQNPQGASLPASINTSPEKKWKMLPPTLKPKPKVKKIVPIIPVKTETSSRMLFSEPPGDGRTDADAAATPGRDPDSAGAAATLSLKQQMGDEEKRRSRKRQRDRGNTGADDELEAEVAETLSKMRKEAGSSSNVESEVSDALTEMRREAEVAGSAQVAGEVTSPGSEFTPHDYSQQDMGMFKSAPGRGNGRGKGPKKGKGKWKKQQQQEQFDPDQEQMQAKFKGVRKTNLNPKSGNKSMTYSSRGRGKDAAFPKMHWPKR